jgi:two-component system nitrate/nitrite sensor histidine kinase NarX
LIPPASGWRHRLPRTLWWRFGAPLLALVVLWLGAGGLFALWRWGTPSFALPTTLLLAATGLALAGLGLAVLLVQRYRELLEPLAHLRNWAARVRGGNLSARIPLPADARGEYAALAHDINALSAQLQSLHEQKNAQVRAQTLRLARKTQSLDILYDVASSLNQPGDLTQLLESFLDTFIELVDARAASVRLRTENGHTRLVASRGLDPQAVKLDQSVDLAACQCGWATTGGGIRIQDGTQGCTRLHGRPLIEPECRQFVVVPIQYQDRILGVYNLFLDRPLSAMGEDIQDLLISVGRHLGLAIEKARLDSNARRLAIMEERNALGDELHDSLAQSLVGMRLQAKMLGESLYRRDWRTAQNELRRLRAAIEEAHASLRDLLANFRLKMDDRGLEPAIRDMVERFNQETDIAVFFQNDCKELKLSTAQEIQLYHIIREALANVRKHSHARHARILLSEQDDGRYRLLIEDDGFGMVPPEEDEEESRPGEHIGLSVMRSRAERLPGELTIESEPGEGTRVVVTFSAATPTSTAAASKLSTP